VNQQELLLTLVIPTKGRNLLLARQPDEPLCHAATCDQQIPPCGRNDKQAGQAGCQDEHAENSKSVEAFWDKKSD
jgi:hypothetical protein